MNKMHAAFVEHFGKPLVSREVDVPTPGPGQILVKTEACGVCHTDLHAATGDWPLKPKLPFIPGHEAIGRVAAVGVGVGLSKRAIGSACPGCIRPVVTANIASRLGRQSAPKRSSAVIRRMAASPTISSPIRNTSPTYRPALTPKKPHPSSAPVLLPTKASRRRRRSPANGLSSRAPEASATLPFSTPRLWGSKFAPSTSMTASSRWPRRSVPTSSSMPNTVTRPRLSKKAPTAARMAS